MRALWVLSCAAPLACGQGTAVDVDGGSAFDAAAPDASGAFWLSETGLYTDVERRELAADALEYAPAHELWSDGSNKTRWILLPPGESIATEDMDRWRFPVGTKLFKEFSVDGVPVETRMIWRTGSGGGEEDYFMGAFLWEEDGSDAVFVPEGEEDALGTDHDVPRAVKCWECHEGEPGRVLGFSALQLSHEGPGVTLATLEEGGALSDPPAPEESYGAPGNEETAAALGYLHANCGHCHNPLGRAYEDVNLVLRLQIDEQAPDETQIHATTVGVPLEKWTVPPYELRVEPGGPDKSGVIGRMSIRGGGLDQMPPIATEVVDGEGVASVSAWITALGPE